MRLKLRRIFRQNTYEPQIISKYNWNADGMEGKILALYICGMSQQDIEDKYVNKLIQAWDRRLMKALVVNFSNGR